MSRCNLDNRKRNTEVCIGWDPGLETYFCTVIDYELGGGPDSAPCIWHGAMPGDIYDDPEPLLDAVTPYACRFDRQSLIEMLRYDKKNHSERVYSAPMKCSKVL